jgi:hypothetical protein
MQRRKNCLQDYKPSRFQKASSASSSDIWEFATKDGEHTVFCKVFSEKSPDSSGLLYEADIYDYIENSLAVDDPLKNCFIKLVCVRRNLSFDDLKKDVMGDFGVTEKSLLRNLMIAQCGNPMARPALDDVNAKITQDFIPDCKQSDLEKFRQMTYAMVVTKKPNGIVMDLSTFLHDPDITTIEKRETLAKTVIAISKMHDMNISHNDQHWGNILVAYDDDDMEDDTYMFGNQKYRIVSPFRPILFDWDRSQVAGWTENKNLSRFGALYNPTYSTTRDWLTFYLQLLMWHKHLFGHGPIGQELAACFFKQESLSFVIPFWEAVIEDDFWEFSTRDNLQALDYHIQVDQKALIKYLCLQ